jgi:hypothetical protein
VVQSVSEAAGIVGRRHRGDGKAATGDGATHIATALSFAAASTYWRLSVAGLPVVLNRRRLASHANATRETLRSRAVAGTAGRPLTTLPTQSVKLTAELGGDRYRPYAAHLQHVVSRRFFARLPFLLA